MQVSMVSETDEICAAESGCRRGQENLEAAGAREKCEAAALEAWNERRRREQRQGCAESGCGCVREGHEEHDVGHEGRA